jgi:hypothetical protein
MTERWISESIEPVLDDVADEPFVVGEPVLPRRFRWRGRDFSVAQVLEAWKELGPAEGGDRYLRKHWYRIRTGDGVEMKLYFERKARSRAQAKRRWWLFSVEEPPGTPPPASEVPQA